ncbi:MAG: efflux RND transporter permease subunit [Planctomycetota bacterium]
MADTKDTVLVRFFRELVQHPIGVLMISIALLGMSLIAAQRIPLELVPSGISNSNIRINAAWPGANPSELEQKVLKPMEQELRSLTNLEEIISWAGDGSVGFNLEFPGNMDMDLVYSEVADRVERARPLLPTEVDRIIISKEGMDQFPVMFAGIQYNGVDEDVAQDMIANVLVPRIEAIDGVASANSWGLTPLSVRIWLDEQKVFANRVDIGSLVARLQGDNVSSPVGDLDDAGSRTIIRVDSRFTSLEEIENFPVRDGLLVKDIGRVAKVRSAPEFLFKFDGEYSTTIQMTKESSANTFELCERLKHELEVVLPEDPILGRFDYLVYFNQGEMIGQSIQGLVDDSVLGGGIACLVLFLFLRRLSYTLLITLSIPFAVLIALSYLYFSGNSLNLMSMMGITISVGMLVDNSVVIVESIFKRREGGADTLDSVSRGPSEVMLAIITATLTTVVVFLPLMFLTDDRVQRVIAGSIGMPMIVALLSALVLSIVMVPVAARFLQHKGTRGKKQANTAGHLPDWMTRPLVRSLDWSLRHRFRAVVLCGLILMSGGIATAGRASAGNGGGEEGQIDIGFDFTDDTLLYDGHEEVVLMEEILNGDEFHDRFPDVATGIWFNSSNGQMMIWPEKPLKLREKEELLDYLQANLQKRARVKFRFEKDFSQADSRDQVWTRIRIEGPESLGVQDLLDQIREAALISEDFTEVSKDRGKDREILVSLDRERMSRLGVNSRSVIGNIEWTMRGFMVSRYETPNLDLPLIIEYDVPTNPDRSSLEEMIIATDDNLVPLSTFAAFTDSRSPSGIFRRDGKLSDSIGLKAASEDIKANYAAAAQLMKGIEMPEGYRWTQDGGWSQTQDEIEELMKAMGLAVGLVFLLMGLLFNSVVLPLSALTTIAFAILGANWAFKIMDQPFGPMEVIGMIVLSGVVVNNGIVLIDRILQFERRGLTTRQAILDAVRDRMRPVFMTAMTTVCGLLPIALSEPAGNGMNFQGLAIGIVGGITVATFFTLTVVPLSFSLLRDLGALFANAFLGKPLPWARVQ